MFIRTLFNQQKGNASILPLRIEAFVRSRQIVNSWRLTTFWYYVMTSDMRKIMNYEPKGITTGLTWQELGTIPKFRMESQKKRNTKYFSHNIVTLGGM
jgi:hypothetical protein